MSSRLRSLNSTKISFFAFQDIITSVSGILILVTLKASEDVVLRNLSESVRRRDNPSQRKAANGVGCGLYRWCEAGNGIAYGGSLSHSALIVHFWSCHFHCSSPNLYSDIGTKRNGVAVNTYRIQAPLAECPSAVRDFTSERWHGREQNWKGLEAG